MTSRRPARLRALAGLLLLAAAGHLGVAPTAGAAEPARIGVSTPGLPALDRFTRVVVRPAYYDRYVAWGAKPAFDATEAKALAARGIGVKITWEPWVAAGGVAQPRYALRTIAAGKHDTYVRSYARGVKRWGGTVTLRFAHEMNGNWYPWGAGVNGNTSADYVAAWRHVRKVFAAEGVRNVRWEWAPNRAYTGSAPLKPLYPGDAHVDRVGLSAYNWGGSQWRSFAQLVDPTLTQLRAITTKPLVISETGTAASGGDKAAWISQMFRQLKARPHLRALTYFNHKTQRDWRVDVSTTHARAFAAGVRALR